MKTYIKKTIEEFKMNIKGSTIVVMLLLTWVTLKAFIALFELY